MSGDKISLMDAHSSISALVFATGKALEDLWVEVSAEWHQHTHLSVRVSCMEMHRQKVVDRLTHGVLVDKYDYRFNRVAHPLGETDPYAWVEIVAYPDLSFDDKRVQSIARKEKANV